MDKKRDYIALYFIVIFMITIFAGTVFSDENSGEKKTIEGVVTEYYQIVTEDDEAYDIGEGEMGDKIMEHVDQKVKATGIIKYDEELESNTITIEKFKVIEEEE